MTHHSDAMTEEESTESYTERLHRAGFNARENRQREPYEKKTTIRFAKNKQSFQMFTAERELMRRLLQHPEATNYSLHVADINGVRRNVSIERYGTGSVEGVTATLPVSTLKIRTDQRKRGEHAAVIDESVVDYKVKTVNL